MNLESKSIFNFTSPSLLDQKLKPRLELISAYITLRHLHTAVQPSNYNALRRKIVMFICCLKIMRGKKMRITCNWAPAILICVECNQVKDAASEAFLQFLLVQCRGSHDHETLITTLNIATTYPGYWGLQQETSLHNYSNVFKIWKRLLLPPHWRMVDKKNAYQDESWKYNFCYCSFSSDYGDSVT